MRCFRAIGYSVLVLLTTMATAADSDVTKTAAQLLRKAEAAGGICVVLGEDVELGAAIAQRAPFVVQFACENESQCENTRKAIRDRNLYGPVSADVFAGPKLPYIDNLVNLIVVESFSSRAKAGLTVDEILRALAPLGTVFFKAEPGTSSPHPLAQKTDDGWFYIKKPWPAEIDAWTHYLHGPDGNPVARDRVVGPPRHYQWIAEPTFLRCHETDSSVSTLVTEQGRLFAIVDEAPISLAGDHSLPDKWFLIARDAFNGSMLWKVPIRRWGWREWKTTWFNTRPGDIPLNIQKRLVAVGDRVYCTLGYRAPVSQIDARTGEILRTYAGTEQANEILVLDGKLFVSLVDNGKLRVAAVDIATGKLLWKTEKTFGGSTVDYIKWKEMNGGGEPVALDPAANLATDGRVVALLDKTRLAVLDAATGKPLWNAEFPAAEGDHKAGGIDAGDDLWVGSLIVRDGVVLAASPSCLAAFDAPSGKKLWEQPKKYIQHLWYEWKDVFVVDRLVWTWSAELDEALLDEGARAGKKQRAIFPHSLNGYDLHSGKMEKSVPLGSVFAANHHHRCYRNKATENFVLTSRRGSEFIDLAGGPHTIHNWVRGTCHVGMMPANGLQYAPPHPCQCYIEEKINGMNALAAESKTRKVTPIDDAARLVRGDAFSKTPDGPAASPADWPAFRHDGQRSGSCRAAVPDDAKPDWKIDLGTRPSPPIVVGDRLFVATADRHQVVCLDARDGRALWQFTAGSRIDSPPTYDRGRLLFGSNDGWVYCVRAEDGRLVWKFHAALDDRRMAAHGHLESAWPVAGSVLVQNDVAYFAAGRSSHLDGGIRLYALDAAMGRMLHSRTLEGPYYSTENVKVNFELPMGALADVLTGDRKSVFLRDYAFDAELNSVKGRPDMTPRAGFLDDNYFKRTPWLMAGEYARLIVHDSKNACYVRMFDSLRGLDPSVYFTPGAKGYLLFAKNATGKKNAWQQRVPVRIRAMAMTETRLYAAGPPDVVDPADPLGAFEGRKGGVFYAIDVATGERIAEHSLDSPPVFNGAAAAGSRLFFALENGTVMCFGR